MSAWVVPREVERCDGCRGVALAQRETVGSVGAASQKDDLAAGCEREPRGPVRPEDAPVISVDELPEGLLEPGTAGGASSPAFSSMAEGPTQNVPFGARVAVARNPPVPSPRRKSRELDEAI